MIFYYKLPFIFLVCPRLHIEALIIRKNGHIFLQTFIN